MKVRALQKGFHTTIREPGDVFDLDGNVPGWCEEVAGEKAAASTQGNEPPKPAGDPVAVRFKVKHNGPGPGVGVGNYAVEDTDNGSRASVVFKKADGDAKEKAEVEADRLNAGGDIDLGVTDGDPSSAQGNDATAEKKHDLPDA